MSENDRYLELIARLGEWEPTVFIFGGFAEDAVLHGAVSRHHADVDLFVCRDQLSLYLSQAHNLGFFNFEVYYEPIPGKPSVLNAEHEGLHLEICVFERDTDGRPYFVVTGKDRSLYRIYLPADAFTFRASVIEGVSIQTLSPLALYQIRDGLIQVEPFGDLRPTDLPAQRLLVEQFLQGKSQEELATEVRRHEL